LKVDEASQGTLDGDGSPAPQLGRQGVPGHLGLGVIAGGTQGLAEPRKAQLADNLGMTRARVGQLLAAGPRSEGLFLGNG
jgi:hypothetical protein